MCNDNWLYEKEEVHSVKKVNLKMISGVVIDLYYPGIILENTCKGQCSAILKTLKRNLIFYDSVG